MIKSRKLDLVIGYGLSFISMLFTMKLLMSFAGSPIESIMYGAFGCLIQLAQTVLFVIGCYAIKQNRTGAQVICFLLYGVLFCLSIAGTLGSFSKTSKQNTTQAELSDTRFQQYQKAIEGIDRQIESSNAQIKEYAAKAYFTNGVKPVQIQLEKLQTERKELLGKIEGFKVTPSGEAMYEWIASFLQVEPQQVKLVLFTAYGICLDLSAAILLAFGCGALLRTEEEEEIESDYYPVKQTTRQPALSHAAAIARQQTQERKPGYIPESDSTENQFREPSNQVQAKKQSTELESSPVQYSTVPRGTVQSNQVESKKAANSTELNLDTLQRYISLLFPDKPRQNGSLVSRRHIADQLEIESGMAEKIHKLLKKAGFIRVEGQFSYPNKTQAEMILLSDTLLNERGGAGLVFVLWLFAIVFFSCVIIASGRSEYQTIQLKTKLEDKACNDELQKALASNDGLNMFCLILGFDVFDNFDSNIHAWFLGKCKLGFNPNSIDIPNNETIKLRIPADNGGYRIAIVTRAEFIRFARLMNEICLQAGLNQPFNLD